MEELSLTRYMPLASLTIQSLFLQKEFILDTPLWAGERRGSNQCQAPQNSKDGNFSQYSWDAQIKKYSRPSSKMGETCV